MMRDVGTTSNARPGRGVAAGSRRSAGVLLHRFLGGYVESWVRGTDVGKPGAQPPLVVASPAGPPSGAGPAACLVGGVSGLPPGAARFLFVDDEPADVRALDAAGAEVLRGTLARHLPAVLDRADKAPMLLVADLVTAGLGYDDLVAMLAGPRSARWPGTDVLLLARADGIRRTAVNLTGGHRSEASLARLDTAAGGPWWRESPSPGRVVARYAERLDAAVPGTVWTAAVSTRPDVPAVFWLLLVTRHAQGGWRFADAVAKARRAWRRALRVADPATGLFAADHLVADSERREERAVVETLKRNLLTTRDRAGEFRIADQPRAVLAGLFGAADSAQLRAAVRELHAAGHTLSTGAGGDIRDHVFRLPPRR